MAKSPQPKHKKANIQLPREIIEIAQLIQSGQLTDWSIKNGSNKTIKFRCFDLDGNIIMIEARRIKAETALNSEAIRKPSTDARRSFVKELRLKGLTQAQIADQIGCCQKTISNDCVALGL